MFTHDLKEALAAYYVAVIDIAQSITNGFINIKDDSTHLMSASKKNLSSAASTVIVFEADKIERGKRNFITVAKDHAELEYLEIND